ncbi:MAG TPA: hypothetical protein VKT80_17800 [Chloroflexota bacterium]|nr:hypothetical protein [Chloroflexota bacterium]
MDAGIVGRAVVAMGAGRSKKSDRIDHGVGVVFRAKVGDAVAVGDELFRLYLSRPQDVSTACDAINRAYAWSDREVSAPPLIVDRIARPIGAPCLAACPPLGGVLPCEVESGRVAQPVRAHGSHP